MESMELARHYRSIFLAGATFNLIVDDDTAWRALARIRAHLEPDGSALIPLFMPAPVPDDQLGLTRTHVTEDGATMRFTMLSVERDEAARLQTARLRYELERDGQHLVEERSWVLHWHTREGFHQLLGDAGLLVADVLAPDGRPAAPDASQFTFWVRPDPALEAQRSIRDRLPPAGRALAAGMLGLDQAIYGERPKVEIVAEADADGLDLGDVDLDLEDPARLPDDHHRRRLTRRRLCRPIMPSYARVVEAAVTIAFIGHADPGAVAAASAYEDAVLPLLADHGAELLYRGRRAEEQDAALPAEVHLIRFPDRTAYDAFLADPRRQTLLDQHGEVFTSKVVVELDTLVER